MRGYFVKERSYTLQIAVDHVEVMHILQAVRDVNQLEFPLVKHLQGQAINR